MQVHAFLVFERVQDCFLDELFTQCCHYVVIIIDRGIVKKR